MLTLIKNGLVYDGTDTPPVREDILVRGGEISRVGTFAAKHADHTIDASNSIVAPGFIDINTSSDHLLTLFSDPEQTGFVKNGVTTIIGGNCGLSLAPLLGHPLHDAGLHGHSVTVNVNWSTVAEFLAVLDRKGLGVNFGTLVGHGALRRLVAGNEPRDLTEHEKKMLARVLESAYKDGAFGLSSGSDTEALRVQPKEMAALVELTTAARRVFALHLRDFEADLTKGVREAVAVAHDTHANMEISHLLPLVGNASRYTESLELIEQASTASFIHFDLHPFDTVERPLSAFLPSWAGRTETKEIHAILADRDTRERLRAHLKTRELHEIRIGHVFDGALRTLEGTTLASFAEQRALDPCSALVELMRVTACAATVFERSVDTALQATLMKSQHAIIASNASSLPLRKADAPRTNAGLALLSWAAETDALTPSQAIAKLTSIPATKYGIQRRGRITEGYAADIVILKDLVPTAVLVNGIPVMEEGALTGGRPGRALRAGS